VKFLEEIGLPELTSEQREELCAVAEKAARNHVLSKVQSSRISVLNVTVDAEGAKPVTVNVEVEVALSPLLKNHDAKQLANEATEKAFASVEAFLRELACKSNK